MEIRAAGRLPGRARRGDGLVAAQHRADHRAAARRFRARRLPGGYLARPDANGFNPGHAFVRIALVHDVDTATAGLTRIARALDKRTRSAAE